MDLPSAGNSFCEVVLLFCNIDIVITTKIVVHLFAAF